MPFGLGIWEIIILAGVLVLLFGAKGAPAMARRLGTGVREMKDAVSEMDPRSVFDAKDEPTAAKPRREIEAAKSEVEKSQVEKPDSVASVAAPVVAAPEVTATPEVAVPPEGAEAEPPMS